MIVVESHAVGSRQESEIALNNVTITKPKITIEFQRGRTRSGWRVEVDREFQSFHSTVSDALDYLLSRELITAKIHSKLIEEAI